MTRKRNLWERRVEDDDFLNVRVGIGTIPLKVKVAYSAEEFSMSTDNLKTEMNNIAASSRDIPNAPVTISLIERNKLVIIGDKYNQESMLKNIILVYGLYIC